MAKKSKETERILTDLKGINGARRRDHFTSGNPLRGLNGWFQVNSTAPNKRRQANRKRCRKKVNISE